jgi:hypothetical protein
VIHLTLKETWIEINTSFGTQQKQVLCVNFISFHLITYLKLHVVSNLYLSRLYCVWPPLLEQWGTEQQVDDIVYISSMLSGELLINRKSE